METKGPRDVIAGIVGGIVLILIGIWGLVWIMPNYELVNAPDSLIPIAGIFNLGLGSFMLWKGITGSRNLTQRKKELEIKENKEKIYQWVNQNSPVLGFYKTTLSSWASGKLTKLSTLYKAQADDIQLADLIMKYPPNDGTPLKAFFMNFQPQDGEFLVGFGDDWFVLTNIRLYQRDGRKNEFVIIPLADIETYTISGRWTVKMVFKLQSGNEIVFEKVERFPLEKTISMLISQEPVN